ncbi:MAG: glycoside hydrolase family 3 protein, partial [Acidobacteria bacterium]|nr:glycoside hydrolase family 3 protein [Acidobacteriota bacterium]
PGAVRALGAAAGAACRALGIHLDLAPVVDLETGGGLLARQQRCLDEEPGRVVELANAFADGLETWQVSGCLKHFPGLGAVPVDTHQSLPELDPGANEIKRHISPFEELAGRIPMVMVAHAITPALGDGARPASLDPGVIERAASLDGTPVIVSDDLEMGAVAGLGDLAELTIAAFDARNHGVIISRSFDQLETVANRLAQRAAADQRFASRLERATARMGTLRRQLVRKLAAVPEPSDETVSQLWDAARLKAEGR